MELFHKRKRFNRNCVASSEGPHVMHSHKKMLKEKHDSSLALFAAMKERTPMYFVKCFGALIEVTKEKSALYPNDMIVIK